MGYKFHNYTPQEFEKVIREFYYSENNTQREISEKLNIEIRIVEKYLNAHLKQKKNESK